MSDTKIRKPIDKILRYFIDRQDLLAILLIILYVTIPYIPVFESGRKINSHDTADFLQYASRHGLVRKSILEYHTFPLRSQFFGGGYPTLGDPEDPSLNPLVLISLAFGEIFGLKIIILFGMLVGSLGMYGLTRKGLGYNIWGALFSSLVFACSLWLPLRAEGGNPNEIYYYFIPLCILFIILARRRRIFLFLLPFLFYTMLSDGKLTFFVSILYIGILCFLEIFPPFKLTDVVDERSKKQEGLDISLMRIFMIALVATFFIGMVRILPALELISGKGGLSHMELYFHPKGYSPEGISAYDISRLWRELFGWKGTIGVLYIGPIPVILFLFSCIIYWKRSLPWLIAIVLFVWLLLAYNAPLDLFHFLWKLPPFNAAWSVNKYFSCPIVLTIALVSGRFFLILSKIRPKLIGHIVSFILIASALSFLLPKVAKIQRNTYGLHIPSKFLIPEKHFFSVKGRDIKRNRGKPFLANTYVNLMRNVGTIDWYTGIPIEENAVPRYFVYRNEQLAIGTNKTSWNAKKWYHFAATADKKEIKVYVNGELEKTVKVQGGLLKVAYNESGISIGANQGKTDFFSGKIDEFRIWSRVLNADEIEKASSGTLLDKLSVKVSELEGLLLYFPFDDGKGNKAKDLSGNDFNGELNGPKWNSGKFGKALEFDGKDDFVGVEPLEVDPDEITIEFWFSPAEKLDSSDSRMDIVYALNGGSRPHITFNRANEINPGAIGFYPEFYSYHKNPSYRGEFFFFNSGNTASGIFRPNSIIVKVRVEEPDVLVINQNFHQDWHTDKGALQNHNGLLSLKLEKPGRYTIHLSYVPLDFYIGLLVTVISLISWCVILPP